MATETPVQFLSIYGQWGFDAEYDIPEIIFTKWQQQAPDTFDESTKYPLPDLTRFEDDPFLYDIWNTFSNGVFGIYTYSDGETSLDYHGEVQLVGYIFT